MKFSLFFLMTAFSLSVFAEYGQFERFDNLTGPRYRLSDEAKAVLNENPCIGYQGQRAVSVTGLYDRQYIDGKEHIGVTSYGDVAILVDNNLLIKYSCFRGTGLSTGVPIGDIVLEDAGVNCASGEILKMNAPGGGSSFFHYRSPRFSNEASSCFNRPSDAVSSTERQIQKDEYGYENGKLIETSKVFGF